MLLSVITYFVFLFVVFLWAAIGHHMDQGVDSENKKAQGWNMRGKCGKMKMKKSMDNSDKDKAIITLHKDRPQRLPAHDCGVGGWGVGLFSARLITLIKFLCFSIKPAGLSCFIFKVTKLVKKYNLWGKK